MYLSSISVQLTSYDSVLLSIKHVCREAQTRIDLDVLDTVRFLHATPCPAVCKGIRQWSSGQLGARTCLRLKEVSRDSTASNVQ